MSKLIGFRLGSKTLQLAQVAADAQGISRNKWVCQAIGDLVNERTEINLSKYIRISAIISVFSYRDNRMLRISEDLAMQLDKEAERLGVTRTLLIALAILRKLG